MIAQSERDPKTQTVKDRTPTMCLVIHAAEVPAEACIDGRGFVIPPNEVYEVPPITCTDHNNNGAYEYTTPAKTVMQALLDQCWVYGLVEVPVIKERGKYGVSYKFDEEAAHATAVQALIAAEERMVLHYVTVQRERMNQNLPALPPNGRVADVIAKRKIDLKKEYNLDPIGYGTVAKAAAANQEMDAMRLQIAEQQRQIAEQNERFNKMMEQLTAASSGGKPTREFKKIGE